MHYRSVNARDTRRFSILDSPSAALGGLAAMLLLQASAKLAAAAPGGHLVIIGGGKRPSSITQRFLQLAGGPAAARLVVIGEASEDPVAAARGSVQDFRALGVTHAEALPNTPERALEMLGQANAVYFTGGDQVRLVGALSAPVVTGLHEVWRRGGVIAGTSAGAAVMSARMITGEEHGLPTEEERFRSIQHTEIEFTNGFGFLPSVIIDQHFITRKRSNRLFSAVLDSPQLIGIGIDESTAIDVGPDQRFEVLGERTVMVIDARRARDLHTGPERRWGATDLRVHLLVAGDQFDLKRGRPERPTSVKPSRSGKSK